MGGSFPYLENNTTGNISINAAPSPLNDHQGAYLHPLGSGNDSDSSRGNMIKDLQVEDYTVIICVIAMLCFGLLGLVSNLALLLTTKCKKSLRSVEYGLPYTLASVNVVLCGFWVPLEVIRLVANHCKAGLPPVFCHIDIAVFNFYVGSLVFINVFISLHRILKFLAISLQDTAFIIAGMGVSLVLGLMFALSVTLDYERTVDYQVCTQTWEVNGESRLSIATIAVNTVWVLVLVITCTALSIIVFIQRKRLHQPQKLHDSTAKDYICPKQSDDLDEAKLSFLNSIPEVGTKQKPPSIKKKLTKNVSIEGVKKLTFGIGSKKGGDSDSDDDDDFDQRMKLKLQKSLSGRRHTVANIGLGETSFSGGRRGSMDPAKPIGNYNYVRKWSVDIVALQDQLENPKAHLTGAASASGALSSLADRQPIKSMSTSSNKITGSITEERAGDASDEVIQMDEDKAEEKEEVSDNNVANGNTNEHLNGVESGVNETENDDCEPVHDKVDMLHLLQVNVVCLLLLLLFLSAVLPHALLTFLQVNMGTNFNRNLVWVVAALFVVQAPLHTVLLAWMDRKLWLGLQRLRLKLTHWRCVCYCNIGKGQGPCLNGPSVEQEEQ